MKYDIDRNTIEAFEAAYHHAVAMAADAPTSDARLVAEDIAAAILVALDHLATEGVVR